MLEPVASSKYLENVFVANRTLTGGEKIIISKVLYLVFS